MLKHLLNPLNYYYNPHAIPLMVVSMLIFLIGLSILFHAKKMVKHVSFFLLCLSFSVWLFSMGLVYLCNNADTALLWYKYFTFFGVAGIMPNGYFFSVAASGLLKKRKKTVIAIFIIACLFYLAEIFTDKFITLPRLYFWGYYPHYEPLSGLFIIFFCGLFIALQRNLWLNYRQESIPVKKAQILTIMAGFMIAFSACVDFVAKFTTIPLYPFGYIPMFIFTCLIAYSIIRYKTFDIETVVHKTVLWILSFLFIVIPVFSLYRLLQQRIIASVGLQFIFWTMSFIVFAIYLRLIQPKIDHLFQRRKFNLEKLLNQFIEDLVHLKGFNNFILYIKDAIANALYPQFIDIFVHNENKKKYVNTANEKTVVELEEKDIFLQWLARNNKIVYREFIYIDPLYNAIRREAENYFTLTAAIVVIPLVLNEKLLGVINLGKKANLKRYSATDFYFLTILKNESSIAISNSLFYENIEEQVRQRTKELLDVQKQLVQAEKLATVGTLAGGVAHEINNPLTAILTNVQMLLCEADKDRNNGLDIESLQLIEEATKRCKTIVRKLMAYAKKPMESAEITPVNLLDVVKNVISFIGYQLEQDNIKLIVETKENNLLVLANQNELEQVVTNMVLNARDAIKLVKKNGDIHILLRKESGCMNIIIKDGGIGIAPEIIPKIFDPFFTTKDVGKGTGLGLSICQSIVERYKGTINVASSVDKGASFEIQFPLCDNRKETGVIV